MVASIKEVKSGYYIDLFDDILIVYPDLQYEVFNIHNQEFIVGTADLTKHSGFFILEYIGEL